MRLGHWRPQTYGNRRFRLRDAPQLSLRDARAALGQSKGWRLGADLTPLPKYLQRFGDRPMKLRRAQPDISAAGHMNDNGLATFSRALLVDVGYVPPGDDAKGPVDQRRIHLDALAVTANDHDLNKSGTTTSITIPKNKLRTATTWSRVSGFRIMSIEPQKITPSQKRISGGAGTRQIDHFLAARPPAGQSGWPGRDIYRPAPPSPCKSGWRASAKSSVNG